MSYLEKYFIQLISLSVCDFVQVLNCSPSVYLSLTPLLESLQQNTHVTFQGEQPEAQTAAVKPVYDDTDGTALTARQF